MTIKVFSTKQFQIKNPFSAKQINFFSHVKKMFFEILYWLVFIKMDT